MSDGGSADTDARALPRRLGGAAHCGHLRIGRHQVLMRFRRILVALLTVTVVTVGVPAVLFSSPPPAGATGTSYRQTVLDDAPVGYWRLNEGTGSAVDETGH